MAEADSIRCCAHCGASFSPRVNKTTGLNSIRARKYCSTKCKKQAASKRATPRLGRKKKPKRIESHCLGCGLHFIRSSVSGRDSGEYCSRGCWFEKKSRVAAERAALREIAVNWKPKLNPLVVAEIAALRRIARYVERPRKTQRPCIHCGVPTIGRMEYRRTCRVCAKTMKRAASKASPSRKRDKRIYKSRRRAVERGATADRIDPIKVFERDGWRCHLCGRSTPRRLRGSYESNAPEIDHVIPLAVGGTHTWGNVKCSCRSCNGAKGAQARGQLGLDIAA